ncbi:methyltransferase family protein [Sinorhizobium mexicanum]|uniref:Isoprenylcysteine carboxylmethyltransferase family protein n=1 Tax=Sinorhizobium mexicanum TaxID=375549 RepID=A0A859QDI1_9HYPH|nr:isoprenylcysteine carboxylmethyltransferase family protein [Sinorhizobium mexicanum]MBP1887578.1 protein-S-isoprenylcysteine O-methyltransferase Ste14 [Sinorhizobium mexicanum]QLL63323.1 isoprenylcysteine carboxylmethyltransferase family protein [Sinorhizobium mexicanum]
MIGRLEDILGKVFLILVFFFLALRQVASIVSIIRLRGSVEFWPLVFSSRSLGLLFLCLVIGLTVIRLPPRQSAEGIEPRLSALAGTFGLTVLVVLPRGTIGPGALIASTVLILIGTALSIYCLFWLGRSFSAMATARKLVTTGPYAIVRHPLYAAEAIGAVGFLIANWSLAALLVGVVHFAFQFRRMFNEERVLQRTFPEYASYASSVPMFIPRPSTPVARVGR